MDSYTTTDLVMIEDNLNDAELIIRALKKIDGISNIVHLLDGVEALNYFFPDGEEASDSVGRLPKVIFLDLKLPIIDGFEILKSLKSNEKTRLIPVVILSSSGEQSDIVKCFKFGVNSYIVKPVDYDNFCRTVSSLGNYWFNENQKLPAEYY